MGTVNVVLGEDTRLNLILGQQLENAVTSVVFDFSAWQTTYGSGTLALSVQRPGDEMPYAVTLTTSGTNATWSVTNLDTAYKGVGHIQLTYTVGSAIKKSVVYKFTVYESLGANGEYPSPGQTWQEEMEQEITDVRADLGDLSDLETTAKSNLVAAINEAAQSGGSGTGMSEDFKQALHDILEKVAYIDENGQTYLNALDNAMWPPSNLASISCVYTQSGTVYDTDSLDSLKTDLVVTAHFDNGSTQTVTTYALSGTLTEGTSIITVSYGGKTTTFTVTVSASPAYVTSGLIHHWDAIDNTSSGHSFDTTTWKDLVGNVDLTKINGTWLSNALSLSSASTDAVYSDSLEDLTDATIEVCFKSTGAESVAFMTSQVSGTSSRRFIVFTDNTIGVISASSKSYTNPESSISDVRYVACDYSSYNPNHVYVNGVETTQSNNTHSFQYTGSHKMGVGGAGNSYRFTGEIYAIRIYNRALSSSEIAQNYAMDVQRFGLGGA